MNGPFVIGCEFQILDDDVHADAKLGVKGNRTMGSLYDLITANGREYHPDLPRDKYVNGYGQWNRARIVVRGGTVQPIDLARVPSFANVDERLKQGAWHFVDGKNYGTPYQWGPNVLMYNTTAIPTPPTSWSVVFEEQKLGDGKAIGGGRGPRAEDDFTPVGGADIAGDAVDSMFD